MVQYHKWTRKCVWFPAGITHQLDPFYVWWVQAPTKGSQSSDAQYPPKCGVSPSVGQEMMVNVLMWRRFAWSSCLFSCWGMGRVSPFPTQCISRWIHIIPHQQTWIPWIHILWDTGAAGERRPLGDALLNFDQFEDWIFRGVSLKIPWTEWPFCAFASDITGSEQTP